jgi:hypothetical protein
MSLQDWHPNEAAEDYFGLERNPKVEVNGVTYRPDIYVSDIEERSLRERLFSKPWRPFKKYKEIARVYYIDDKSAVCSYKTFRKIQDAAK